MHQRFQRPRVLQEIDQLQSEMNRLFDATNKRRVFNAPAYPAINIWVNKDGQLISAEMPGVHPEDLDIDVTGDALSISGVRRSDEVAKEARYHRRERNHGSFSRTIQLPFMVDTSRVEASFKNGVLFIILPRAEADKPRRIAVKSK
jgi:HSP20 family protein